MADVVWWAIIGPAAIAAGAALSGQGLAEGGRSRREAAKWRRDERRQAYESALGFYDDALRLASHIPQALERGDRESAMSWASKARASKTRIVRYHGP
jgi:hypothetical protein